MKRSQARAQEILLGQAWQWHLSVHLPFIELRDRSTSNVGRRLRKCLAVDSEGNHGFWGASTGERTWMEHSGDSGGSGRFLAVCMVCVSGEDS